MIAPVIPNYLSPPDNYGIVTPNLSRSAQPNEKALLWLKQKGVTDIVNFRTMIVPAIGYNEEKIVQGLGMNYHNIPSITAVPKKNLVMNFLDLMEEIVKRNGKVHIHCKQGADRTGMYAFIYKELHHIGKKEENIQEWLNFGHHKTLFPNLIPWALDFIRKVKKG